jgi:thiamine monophosphate kinase
MYAKRRVWQAETGHEDEGPGERSTRHLEHMIKKVEIDVLFKEAHAALDESDALLQQLI